MCKNFYAHSPNKNFVNMDWHLLSDHLKNTSALACQFAKECLPNHLSFSQTATMAGLLHDLGKYRETFQEYLRGKRVSSKETQHAIFGACGAKKYSSIANAIVIDGHHGGLHFLGERKSQFDEYQHETEELLNIFHNDLKINPITPVPPLGNDPLELEMMIRFLFSCLVDADWLDTARYCQNYEYIDRKADPVSLFDSLLKWINSLPVNPASELNTIRRDILQHAIKQATLSQGFFSMTVPTGGGKTLSSMAFALEHMKTHHLNRVIVVIPFLSIIEQNARIYKRIFGDEQVIEHHCAVNEQNEDRDGADDRSLRLSIENWNAPIIVTTAVQFVESLFSNRPSRCRKLHNIANSVVIFDECQSLPLHVLTPLMHALKQLANQYRVSVVFCSATQPAFDAPSLDESIPSHQIREIAPEPARLFQQLKRVRYHFPPENPVLWEDLADQLCHHEQVLVIVNTRRQAYELFECLRKTVAPAERDSLFHLSSRLCAEHRMDILGVTGMENRKTIHGRLKLGLPCIVVSTQLVEAGVDIDFPVVFRAIGPMDSIVQAAGRCNREGKLPQLGEVYLFKPDSQYATPPGSYKIATDKTLITLGEIQPLQLVEDPSLFLRFFANMYSLCETQANTNGGEKVQEARKQLKYPYVANAMRMIKDDTETIVIPYGRAQETIRTIREQWYFTQSDMRSLQRVMVSARSSDYKFLQKKQMILPIIPNSSLYVLNEGLYDPIFGLVIEERSTEDYIL